MSRVTPEEVQATAQALLAKGIKPTTIKIREALGKGSYTTIGKFLEDCQPLEEAAPEAPEVPKAVKALLPHIWATCYAEAYTEAKKAAQAETSQLRAELAECRESLASAQKALDSAEETIEQLENQAKARQETSGKRKQAKTRPGTEKPSTEELEENGQQRIDR